VGAAGMRRGDAAPAVGHEPRPLLRRGALPDPEHARRLAADGGGKRHRRIDQQLARVHRRADLGHGLVMAAKRHAQHDQLVRRRGGGIVEPADGAVRYRGQRALRRLLGAAGVARADRDLDTGRGQTHGKPEAKCTRRADDRDGGVGDGHAGSVYGAPDRPWRRGGLRAAGAHYAAPAVSECAPSCASKRARPGKIASTKATLATQARPPLSTEKRGVVSDATVPDSMSPRRAPPVTTSPKTAVIRPRIASGVTN